MSATQGPTTATTPSEDSKGSEIYFGPGIIAPSDFNEFKITHELPAHMEGVSKNTSLFPAEKALVDSFYKQTGTEAWQSVRIPADPFSSMDPRHLKSDGDSEHVGFSLRGQGFKVSSDDGWSVAAAAAADLPHTKDLPRAVRSDGSKAEEVNRWPTIIFINEDKGQSILLRMENEAERRYEGPDFLHLLHACSLYGVNGEKEA